MSRDCTYLIIYLSTTLFDVRTVVNILFLSLLNRIDVENFCEKVTKISQLQHAALDCVIVARQAFYSLSKKKMFPNL